MTEFAQEIAGKAALITGAGRGIGRAAALALAAAGVRVGLNGRKPAPLEEVRAAIVAQGGTAIVLPCDISDPAAVDTMVAQAIGALGPIELLVNNAGVNYSGRFIDMPAGEWERIMAINVHGPYYCCRALVPGMLANRWGRIVNIASIAATIGMPFGVAYSSSKHALLGMTRSLGLELQRYGIMVNAVCPAWVATEMYEDAAAQLAAKTGRDLATARAELLRQANQPRAITVEEVAAEVLALLAASNTRSGEAILMP